MTLSLPKTKRFAASSRWLRKERHVLTCVNINLNNQNNQEGRNDWIGYDERKALVFFLFTYLALKIGLPQIPRKSR
jgi:hypothetical protein